MKKIPIKLQKQRRLIEKSYKMMGSKMFQTTKGSAAAPPEESPLTYCFGFFPENWEKLNKFRPGKNNHTWDYSLHFKNLMPPGPANEM